MRQLASDHRLPAAEAVLANHGKSFYLASIFLPKSMAHAAARLYRFCRYVDDVADDGGDPQQAAAQLDQISSALLAGQGNTPLLRDACALFRAHAIPQEIPAALIQGVRSDLAMTQMTDIDSLLRYSYRVAGTVGIMMAKILQAKEPQAYYHAVDLGIAMQLTNICRDVTEDAHRQRVYLPQSLLRNNDPAYAFALIEQQHPSVLSAVGQLLALADRYYESGYQGLRYLPLRARLGILIAAKLYQRIGHEILRHPEHSLRQRTFVHGLKKCGVVAASLCQLLVKRCFWPSRPPSPHQRALHRSLFGFPLIHD